MSDNPSNQVNLTASVDAWTAELNRLIEAAKQPCEALYRLAPLPATVDPESDLRSLAGVWLRHIGERNADQTAEFIASFLGESHRGEVRRSVLPIVARMETRIVELFKGFGSNFPDVGLVPSSAFGRWGLKPVTLTNGKESFAACVPYILPDGHWLLKAFRPEDAFQGNGPELVLGLAVPDALGHATPKPFYPTASVLRLTASHRAEQLRKEADDRRELERQSANDRRLARESPESRRVDDLERQVAELKAAIAGKGGGT